MEKTIYGDVEAVELFGMLNNGDCISLKDVVNGGEFTIKKGALIEKDDETTVLFLVTEEGDTMSTTSGTAIKTFLSAISFFGTHRLRMRKVSGQSKSGRNFVNLQVVEVAE